uniref:Uncharacterized protein n=1 Tax=Clytia hemisphaerica TaxID=252671 RepID=A0A7M5V834_9CNID
KIKIKMKNHLTVNIGNNPPSIFYWCDADSYDNLKKCIEKRFEIPTSCQDIEYQGIILNTETFEELYQKRLQFDFELDVNITDSLIDPVLVRDRRNLALKKGSGIRNIKMIYLSSKSSAFQINYKDLDISTTVLDLKKIISAKKRVSTKRINFIYGKKLMILTDNQLLVDLFMDGSLEYTQFSFHVVVITVDDCIFDMFENDDENAYIKFSEIKISMQGIEAIRQIGYPIFDMGSFYPEDMKLWIKDLYQIPIEEQTIGYCDGPIFTDNEDLSRVWLDRSYRLENVELQLYVHYTDKTELKEIYGQNDTKMMEPSKIVSGNKKNIWYHYYRGNSGPSLNDFLHETFRIRNDLRRFLFFVNQNPVKHSQIDLFRCKEIKLAIQVDDDETDLLKHLEPLG